MKYAAFLIIGISSLIVGCTTTKHVALFPYEIHDRETWNLVDTYVAMEFDFSEVGWMIGHEVKYKEPRMAGADWRIRFHNLGEPDESYSIIQEPQGSGDSPKDLPITREQLKRMLSRVVNVHASKQDDYDYILNYFGVSK